MLGSTWAQAQAPGFDMAVAMGSNSNLATLATDIVVDAAGNSYVTGFFGGTINVNGSNITADKDDIFVAKLDPVGRIIWFARAGGNAQEFSNGIALDGSGNVYITGDFLSPTIRFGSSLLTNSFDGPDYNSREIYVAKLDANGNWVWGAIAGGAGPDTGHDIAVDGGGNAYITGSYMSAASFGSTLLPLVRLNGTSLSPEVFVAKLSSQGTWLWARNSGSGAGCRGTGIGLDAVGNLYVAGSSTNLLPGAWLGPFGLPTAGLFVAKLTTQNGSLLWATGGTGATGYGGFGAYTYSGSVKLAVDGQNNPVISGSFIQTLQLGPYALTASGSGSDGFVAKLDAAGAYRWATQTGDGGRDLCNSIAADANGNCFVTGSFENTARFGSFSLTAASPNTTDAFTAMLGPTGTWRWVTSVSGPRIDNGICVAVGPGRTTYLGGETLGYPVRFGDGSGAAIGSVAGLPGFVARLQPYPSLALSGDSLVCRGGQVQLTATTSGAVSGYRWSTGATSASIAVTQPGTYSVTATFGGGYTLTETYRVRSIAPTVQISGGTEPLCPGASATLTATAPEARSLRWSTGATTPGISVSQPGTYSITAQYSSGCAVTEQVVVVGNALNITGRQQLCPGQSTTLTAAGTGAAVVGYRWSGGETTPTLRVSQAGTYWVTATFANGCTLTKAHSVGPPTAKVASVSGDTLLCPGTTLRLTALNPDALTYQWNTGATTPDITLSTPGRYSVLLTYSGGCTSRDSLEVQTAPLAPVFTLGPDTTLCLEKTLVLRAPAVSGPGVVLRWSDGSTGSTLRVSEPGQYSLRITTPCDTRTASRNVAYEPCFKAPNIITPNNDNLHDTFVINELSRGPWRLEIYSRWGKKVYQTEAYQNDWGPDAAPGVYYYLLRPAAGSGEATRGWLEVVR
ncbi:SBBP repeat-containing protein [Hymenobacter chitinivorans]|uniref:SBBP repeat-containing protein n=1 Tax=Hymenobacter chitinivorans TaxID=89969 RepID=UPI001475F2E7|nr:SBBP repeat-containing protein [Hymenobacter chitinivorans]